MAANSNSGKKGHIASDVLKSTVGYIKTGAWGYFTDAMPTTSSTIGGIKDTAKELASSLKNTTQSILPKRMELKRQLGIRNILSWYTEKEEEFDDDLEGFGADLGNWDDPSENDNSDDSKVAEPPISETERSTNKLRKTFYESSHKLAESTLEATANIVSSITKSTEILATGFKTNNELLKNILDVVTRNTAVVVETSVANLGNQNKESASGSFLRGGKFDFDSYKNVLKGNFENSELGMVASMAMSMVPTIGMFLNGGGMQFKAADIVPEVVKWGMGKLLPKLGGNLQALDESVGDAFMSSLIKLGDFQGQGGVKGFFADLFGIDSSRKDVSTGRDELKLGSTKFDTITRESIINTIPGYLRKILAALGGEDLIYDYKTRAFKTSGEIEDAFRDDIARSGTLWGMGDNFRKFVGSDQFSANTVDMLATYLGAFNPEARNEKLASMKTEEGQQAVIAEMTADMDMDESQMEAMNIVFSNIGKAMRNGGLDEFARGIATSNAQRNYNASQIVNEYRAYNTDISDVQDNYKTEVQAIAERAGIKKKSGTLEEIGATGHNGSGPLTGIDYTNNALYQIFRRLDTGINVFQVGKKNTRPKKFESMESELKPPAGVKPRQKKKDDSILSGSALVDAVRNSSPDSEEGDGNLLENRLLADGSSEDLTKGQRFGRWAKSNGKNLFNAIIKGNPEDVKAAMGKIMSDVTHIAGKGLKDGMGRINQQFGNVTGFLKHKLFGSPYQFQDGVDEDGKPIVKKIAKNEKGGIFGFVKDWGKDMIKGPKEAAKKWVKSVGSLFNFKSGKKEEEGVEGKRKKLLSTIMGTFAGAGILGGPIGLLVGGIAGNALSFAGMGDKIKGLLFGRDKKTGKAKGILTKVGDAIVSPIKFQIGKTVESVARGLKKNIFAPLANLGHAIKDRITGSAESHFGKFFGKIVKVIMSPFKTLAKAPAKLFGLIQHGVIGAVGGLTRSLFGVGSHAVGSGINRIASFIGGKSTHINEDGSKTTFKDFLKQRKKDIAKETRQERRESKFSSYKEWKKANDAEHAARMAQLNEYLQEDTEKIEETTSNIQEGQEEVKEDVSDIKDDIADVITTSEQGESSLSTQDRGIYSRLDSIIDTIRDFNNKTDDEPGDTGSTQSSTVADSNNPVVTPVIDSIRNASDAEPEEKPSDTGSTQASTVADDSTPIVNPIIDNNRTTSGGKLDDEPSEAEVKNAPADNSWMSDSVNRIMTMDFGSIKTAEDKEKERKQQEEDAKIKDEDKKNTIAGAALQTVATVSSAQDGISESEKRDVDDVVGEVNKDDPNTTKITSRIKNLFSKNKEQSDVEQEKKSSLWETITGFLGGISGAIGGIVNNIPLIAAAAGGLWMLFNNPDGLKDIISGIGDVVTNVFNLLGGIGSSIGNFFNTVRDPDSTTGDAIMAGANMGSSVVDVRADDMSDYYMPGNTLSHVQTNANGQDIANSAANELKNLPLKQDVISYVTTGKSYQQNKYVLSSDQYMDKATKYENKANAYTEKANQGGWFSNFYKKRADHYNEKAENALEGAVKAEDASNKVSTGIVGTIGHSYLKSKVHSGISTVTGKAAGWIAGLTGMDEEKAAGIEKTASGITSAGLMLNSIKKGDKSIVNKATKGLEKLGEKAANSKVGSKVIDVIKKGLDFLVKQFKKVPVFAKFGEKIGSFFSKIKDASIKGLTETLIKKALTKLGVSSAASIASVASAGITVAVGALNGLASGLCSVEHLFGVLPGEADGTMKTIAGIMGTAFGALEMSPAAPIVAILDILDIILQPAMGVGIKQGIARMLYGLLAGEEKEAELKQKQEDFEAERQYYAETYGKDLNTATFNDMVNNTGWIDKLWRGGAKYDDEGHILMSETGNRIDGGLKSLFVGSDDVAARDAEGNVIKDAEGNILSAKDKYGNVIKKDEKWGDKVGKWFKNNVVGFFTGNTEYETDANGQMIYDEEGNPIVKKEAKNIFQRWGDGVSSFWNKTFGNEKDESKGFFGRLADGIGGYFKNIYQITDEAADKVNQEYLLDENDNPQLDKNGNPIKISDVPEILGENTNTVAQTMSKSATEISDVIAATHEGEWELDNEGNPLEVNIIDERAGKVKRVRVPKGKLADYVEGNIETINTYVTEPIDDVTDAISEISDAADGYMDSENTAWQEEGFKSYDEWVFAKLNNLTLDAFNAMMGELNGADIHANVSLPDDIDTSVDVGSTIPEGGDNGPITPKPIKAVTSSIKNELADPKGEASGIAGPPMGGMVSKADEEMKNGTSTPADSTTDKTKDPVPGEVPGGNPLNKEFDVTSKWGWRDAPFSGFHKGVDLVPADKSGIAEVGSRFNGTVEEIKTNVSDEDHAEWYDGGWHYDGPSENTRGNYVKIRADDGRTVITNMHLKYGSIPKSITPGAKIKVGDKIGTMGTTGWSTGNHLHYQMEDTEAPSNGEQGQSFDPEDAKFGIHANDDTLDFRSTSNQYYTPSTSSSGKSGDASFTDSNGNMTLDSFTKSLTSLSKGFMNSFTYGFVYNDDDDNYSSVTKSGSSPYASYQYKVTEGDNDTEYEMTGEEAADAYLRARDTYRKQSSSDGRFVEFPEEYGTYESWEPEMVGAGKKNGYHNWETQRNNPRHGWASDSFQGLIRRHAIANNRYKAQDMYGLKDIATIDDRPLIATNHNIGNNLPLLTGDMVKVEYADGDIWHAMIADSKSQDGLSTIEEPTYDEDGNKNDPGDLSIWGHDYGKNSVELIYDKDPTVHGISGNLSKKVIKITKEAEYNPSSRASKPPEEVNETLKNEYSNNSTDNDEEEGGDPKGGGNDRSTIKPANPKPRKPVKHPKPRKAPMGGEPSNYSTTDSGSSYQPSAPVRTPIESTDNSNRPITEILVVLYEMISELKKISNNTGESSDWLETLNSKDFVDNGLREELLSLGNSVKRNVTRNKSSYRGSGAGANNVIAIARPS